MKTCYFSTQNIDTKSKEMLKKVEYLRLMRHIQFIPKNSALLILDMQKYFLDEKSHAYIPSALPVIQKIKQLATVFNYKNLPVILTQHLNTDEDAQMMALWWNDLLRNDDPLGEIIPDLHTEKSIVINKTQYDAFYKTELDYILKDRKINQLVITGVMSHLCCDTTARSAFTQGYAVFFTIDGTATYNEDFHNATIQNLAHGFVIPVLTDEILSWLENYRYEC